MIILSVVQDDLEQVDQCFTGASSEERVMREDTEGTELFYLRLYLKPSYKGSAWTVTCKRESMLFLLLL